MDETERKLLHEVLVKSLSDPAGQVQLARVGRFLAGMQAAAMAVAEELHGFAVRHRLRDKVTAALVVVDAAIQKVKATPPSPGYEPLLISRGVDPVVARMSAFMIVRYGSRKARRSNDEDQVIPTALRNLSQPGRRARTIATSAAMLRDLPDIENSLVAVFDGVGRADDGQRFLALLDRAATADPTVCRELAGIAQSVAGQLETRRGPRISVASASHQLALDFIWGLKQPIAYTFNAYKNRFTDPVTLATMLEFGIADFDPRPAVRRLRKERQSAK